LIPSILQDIFEKILCIIIDQLTGSNILVMQFLAIAATLLATELPKPETLQVCCRRLSDNGLIMLPLLRLSCLYVLPGPTITTCSSI
jgi:hypothetical protein